MQDSNDYNVTKTIKHFCLKIKTKTKSKMPAKNVYCLGGLDEGWATLVLQGTTGTPKPVKQEHFEAVVLKKVGDKLLEGIPPGAGHPFPKNNLKRLPYRNLWLDF